MAQGTRTLRLVMVGWGSLARRTITLLQERNAQVDLVAIGLREGANRAAVPGTRVLIGAEALERGLADLVVEAAGATAVEPWGQAAFAAGADFAPISVSALADEATRDRLTAAADLANRRLLIPNGAIGGIDILRAAALLPLTRVEHIVTKPPAAWKGTPAERMVDLDSVRTPHEFMVASARVAAATFPQNGNATVTTALAGIGLDRTLVRLVVDPTVTANRHTLRIEGAAGTYEICLSNRAMATNPKSSEMTALSLVTLIEREAGSFRA
ncbi:MAG: aspartate dehydrogenase [Proteobacteria bacterium]|nr:aspartate dehydrogenase [Pseudomonadota bacterium]